MTKSKVKAKDNSVVVIIGGVEHYALPTEIHLGDRSLGDLINAHDRLVKEHESLQKQHQGLTKQFTNFVEETNNKLELLQNNLTSKIDAFDIKLLNVVKGVISK